MQYFSGKVWKLLRTFLVGHPPWSPSHPRLWRSHWRGHSWYIPGPCCTGRCDHNRSRGCSQSHCPGQCRNVQACISHISGPQHFLCSHIFHSQCYSLVYRTRIFYSKLENIFHVPPVASTALNKAIAGLTATISFIGKVPIVRFTPVTLVPCHSRFALALTINRTLEVSRT